MLVSTSGLAIAAFLAFRFCNQAMMLFLIEKGRSAPALSFFCFFLFLTST
jgi:uncharacterized membrane protein required for colicin V production